MMTTNKAITEALPLAGAFEVSNHAWEHHLIETDTFTWSSYSIGYRLAMAAIDHGRTRIYLPLTEKGKFLDYSTENYCKYLTIMLFNENCTRTKHTHTLKRYFRGVN